MCAHHTQLVQRRLLLAAGTLSLLVLPRCEAAQMATAASDIPSNVQTIVKDVFQIYSTKDQKEIGNLVKIHYREDAHFTDPLMNMRGPEEIALAFVSLPKIFKEITMVEKGITHLADHELPKDLQTGTYEQYAVRNQQTYHLSQSGFLAKHLFPEVVDLDVTTTLILDPQSNKIVRHTDVWNNKGFGIAGFLKRPNGAVSGTLFKLLGWKKDAGLTS